MKHLFGLLVFLPFLFFFSCSTTQKFDRLRTETKDASLLYVLRPVQPVQALLSFGVELYGYEGSFKAGKRSLLKEWSLDSGEFSVLELKPGFYSLQCRDMDRIFFLKEGTRNFISLELFSKGPFTLPELFIREIETEAALRYLLEGKRMYQIKEEEKPSP